MLINRDWNLDEETDFQVNIAPIVTGDEVFKKTCEAVPQYFEGGMIAGWTIQGRYE